MSQFQVVSVSSVTGAGIDDFFKAVDLKVEEYKKDYLPELEKARDERAKKKTEHQEEQLDRLMSDMKLPGSSSSAKPRKPKKDVKVAAGEPELDTLSDAIDSDGDDALEGDLDEEDHSGDGRMGDGGLVDRYNKALHGGSDGKAETADESFMRYLQAPR